MKGGGPTSWRGGLGPWAAIHWGGRLGVSDDGANSKSIMRGTVVTLSMGPGKGRDSRTWPASTDSGGIAPTAAFDQLPFSTCFGCWLGSESDANDENGARSYS